MQPASSPYGYILVAPANFSKKARDVFREELRERGVMEFYLWGAAELEDLLFQPKNDHILFAFFGISLQSRRRKRTTEVRAAVAAKNKLIAAMGKDPGHQPVLLRDINDTNYPYEGRYEDFDAFPRWQAHHALQMHPLGLVVSMAKYFAYIDLEKGEFDFTTAVNKTHRPRRAGVVPAHENENAGDEHAVSSYWEQLPHARKAMFVRNGIVRFRAIEFIDVKGDLEYDFPHIFVNFKRDLGGVHGTAEHLEINEHWSESLEDLKRIKVFPEEFPGAAFGDVHTDSTIVLDPQSFAPTRQISGRITLYFDDSKHLSVNPTDVIVVEPSGTDAGEKAYLKITNIRLADGKELLRRSEGSPTLQQNIETQIGRTLGSADRLQIVEAVSIYDWQIDQNRPIV